MSGHGEARTRHAIGRRSILLILIVATVALTATLTTAQPLLAYNPSPSAPQGLYLVSRGRLHRGDLVLAWLPLRVRNLAAGRGYVPLGIPLLKHIAAGAGDRVCALQADIVINGHSTARRLAHDSLGRPLPGWAGCVTLREDEILLLNSNSHSFDGRYFGIINARAVTARARPLWLF